MLENLAYAELIAVLVAVTDNEPRVMTVGAGEALPSGPFETTHRSLQSGLRAWIESQTGHPVGYLEQLYTFADRDRATEGAVPAGVSGAGAYTRHISIGYLGLVREQVTLGKGRPEWRSWYEYFPWEDHRERRPEVLGRLTDRLLNWAGADVSRLQRVEFLFGLNGLVWNEDLVLQRYELIYEAQLEGEPGFGRQMAGDHRRILATGITRLRAKIKYYPVVFELMPDSFTLLDLQRMTEALAGVRLHKPNFRRQVDQQNLLEETGEMSSETGGRPAKLFRYRPVILEASALSGVRLPYSRH